MKKILVISLLLMGCMPQNVCTPFRMEQISYPKEPTFKNGMQLIKTTKVSRGTAFYVKHEGLVYLVTATHVLEEGWAVVGDIPTLGEGKTFGDDGSAFLVKGTPNSKIWQINSPKIGEPCIAAGYTMSGVYKEISGIVTAKEYMSINVEHGMSGGPVIQNGKVIGVISARIKDIGLSKFTPLMGITYEKDN